MDITVLVKYTDCLYSEYICNTTCLPFTTLCDGSVDCTLNNFNGTTLDYDESPLFCAGKIDVKTSANAVHSSNDLIHLVDKKYAIANT